jgi:hypothetical protein
MKRLHLLLTAFILAAMFFSPAPSAYAAAPTFTLAVKSAFAHAAPSNASRRAASLFKGQTFVINGQTADGQWLRLDYAGITTEAWILKAYGTVNGDLSSVPVTAPSASGSDGTSGAGGASNASAPPGNPDAFYPSAYPVIPAVSQTARDIYQRGLQGGTRPNVFTRVGDCQSVVPYFLAAFDYGNYDLGPYTHLQAAIDQFSGSWARQGMASNRGFNVSSVFVPVWSDPKACLKNEGPLACEFRIRRPSLVIISMETWWGGDPIGYEKYLRRIIEYAIGQGAVPILGTKADNIEGDGSLNRVIVNLATEYDIPLWNFWAAVQPLPNHGLHPDGFHLTWERNYYNNADTLNYSWPVRNLTALQAIDAVWRGVSAP